MEKNDALKYVNIAANAAVRAGRVVFDYSQKEDKNVTYKRDWSPVTLADKEASRIILDMLLPSGIPVICEEEKVPHYKERKNWEKFWIIDPIDGTRDFIKGGDDYTVNVALVIKNEVQLGVVFLPATNELYYGVKNIGAYKDIVNNKKEFNGIFFDQFKNISPRFINHNLTVIVSKSVTNFKMRRFLKKCRKTFGDITIVKRGSSLKYCLMAEGQGDVFPRFHSIKEWDTAAGQAIAEAAGCKVSTINGKSDVLYNKKSLKAYPTIVYNSIEIGKIV